MSWNRETAAAALLAQLEAAIPDVKVHPRPPETLNPMTIVVSRPQPVSYGVAGLMGVDEASLPLVIVGAIETEDLVESLKDQARAAVQADQTLGGKVKGAWPAEERNWRNMTGAGGIQLLVVELVLTIHM